jgi:hypothetical protein
MADLRAQMMTHTIDESRSYRPIINALIQNKGDDDVNSDEPVEKNEANNRFIER